MTSTFMETSRDRKPAYRDGVDAWTENEVFEGPGGEIIEVLYKERTGGKKLFFVELQGIPACAHGDTIEEAIEDAREKRDGTKPLTEEEKKRYQSDNFKFSVRLFRKLTRACRAGCDDWLSERGLDSSTKMTLREFRKAGGGIWADKLEEVLQ